MSVTIISPSSPRRSPAFGLTAVGALVIVIFLAAGWVFGTYVASTPANNQHEATTLEQPYSRGYLDGMQAGRVIADTATAPLTPQELNASLARCTPPQLSNAGPSYHQGYSEGARSGLVQRLTERFGVATTATPSSTTVAQTVEPVGPAVVRVAGQHVAPTTVVLQTETSPSPAVSPSGSPSAHPQNDEATAAEGGGIRRIVHPDGTVEYTNI
jgi:hypothetical protein